MQGAYNLAGSITTASGNEWRLCNIFLAYAVEPADQRNRRSVSAF
ncbi:hypothetical protein ACLK2B_16820 [Escherichia coli]